MFKELVKGIRVVTSRYVREVKEVGETKLGPHKELMLWDFTKEETLKHWDCISDADIDGNSWAVLESNKRGGAVFRGSLSTVRPPKATYSGYCAIRSHIRKPTWYDNGCYDLSPYDALRLRIRGDGRKFVVNIQCQSMVKPTDVWQFFMFTRGGPYWEDITLPFHNFVVTDSGYLQDFEFPFNTERVTSFGVLLGDRVNGPFTLEIEHIKAVRGIYLPKYYNLILPWISPWMNVLEHS